MRQPITVLGLGNILLGDEGVGVRVIERLQAEYDLPQDLDVVDGGTAGIDLLPYVKADGVLIIVDAAKVGRGPGSTMKLEGPAVPAFLSAKLSPHQIGLPDLLATAELLGQKPRRLVLIGVEPKTLETGIELSDEIKATTDTLLEMVREELMREGVVIERHG